jgi:hypothetical protein
MGQDGVLALIFYIFSQYIFTDIAYGADKISVSLKSMFFPEMFFQKRFVMFPNMEGCIAFYGAH